ncbi:hypothetical protein CF086_17550 [Clostridium botulinum]|uniref:hypothetical protein n=1 Tax=Clostridium botulinum TaxID=1491 RepID=UPI000773EE31|nr:hypothetical protein [Clostridium botulinum]MBN3352104.1 hypothetical protein [Clostridium botulinum]
MEFKIGDKVRIREDLIVDKKYGKTTLLSNMERYKGVETSVVDMNCFGCYLLKDSNGYAFDSKMLEPVEEEFTFSEVIARIEPNEIYESTVTFRRLTSIHMNEYGFLELRYIKNDAKGQPQLLLNDVVYIERNQRFKLKETKKPFTIYYVEHKPNNKQYKFISNERLDVNNFVVCDTQFGEVYGRIVSYEEDMLTEKESNQLKKCWKA